MGESLLLSPIVRDITLTVVGTAVGYFASKFKQSKDLEFSTLEKRYKSLYEPLLQLIIESWPYVKIPSTFNPELREKFITLFKENVGQMGASSFDYYPEFYESYLFYTQEIIGNELYKNATQKFDIKFNLLCNKLLKECSEIRVKLKYPALSEKFTKGYSSVIDDDTQ
ncbi:hypothetical protein ACV7JQ_07180 [Globicatella sulfidifaciens]